MPTRAIACAHASKTTTKNVARTAGFGGILQLAMSRHLEMPTLRRRRPQRHRDAGARRARVALHFEHALAVEVVAFLVANFMHRPREARERFRIDLVEQH